MRSHKFSAVCVRGGTGKERRTSTWAVPPAEGWQLANPSSPCCQQDSPASRSHLVLEKSCGNPRALQPSEHRLLSSASPSWSAPLLCLQWAQGAGSSTGRVKHTRVPPGDRTELGDSLAQPHHLQQQDHNGMGEMWPPPHGLKPQPEATLLLLAAAPAPSLAALQSLHAAPLARGHTGGPGTRGDSCANSHPSKRTVPRGPHRRHGSAGAGRRGLTFTPSFFLLPPLLPPGERRKEVRRARQGTRTRRPRISSMVPGGRAPRVSSSLQPPPARPQELRGDPTGTVQSFWGASPPGT